MTEAVVVAIIATVSSLLTAGISSVYQDNSAQKQFLRTQRQVAYAKFFGDEQKITDRERQAVLDGRLKRKTPAAVASDLLGPISTAQLDTLHQDLANVLLISSRTLGNHTDDLFSAREHSLEALQTFFSCLADRKPSCTADQNTCLKAAAAAFSLENTFLSDARSDLGAS